MKRLLASGCSLFFSAAAVFVLLEPVLAGETKAPWQLEWEEALAAAHREGQITIYGRLGTQHEEVFDAFKKAYPRIKLNYVQGGGQNIQRIFAERRAGKYLVDVALVGAATSTILVKGEVLDPVSSALIMPENKDPSAWFANRHLYGDFENRHVFVMGANVDSSLGAYNTKLLNPEEVKSHWDLLNPRWRGKIVVYDPLDRGHSANWKGMYYHPRVGGEFVRRFFSEMGLVISRDQRQMLDWVAKGRFHLALPINETDVLVGQKQGLPVDVLYRPPDESYMSSAAGQVVLINKAPHPNAAKVAINWLLSRKGQIEFQAKTDLNSLRVDIPKEMLSNPRSIPKEGVEYLMASRAQYSDVGPLLEVVRKALASAQKN